MLSTGHAMFHVKLLIYMFKSILLDSFSLAGISPDKQQIGLLSSYYDIVIEYNKKINLTRITSPEDFINKNILDTYHLLKYLKLKSASLIDIGTGFGVPGIIIKIFIPNYSIYLLDSSKKKCDFLSLVIKKLNLNNITILNTRAESLDKFDKKYFNFFNYAVSRAFGHLQYISEVSLPYLQSNGILICQKSINQTQEIKESIDHIKILGGNLINSENYELFHTGVKRNIILIQKLKNSPYGYPRTFNKIKKSLNHG